MVRGTRIAVVLGAVVLFASACGKTEGDTPFSPEVKPAFNGGLGMGGNATDDGSGTGTQTTGTGTTTTTESDSTSISGGLGMGGN